MTYGGSYIKRKMENMTYRKKNNLIRMKMYILSHYVYANICNVNSIEIDVLFNSIQLLMRMPLYQN